MKTTKLLALSVLLLTSCAKTEEDNPALANYKGNWEGVLIAATNEPEVTWNRPKIYRSINKNSNNFKADQFINGVSYPCQMSFTFINGYVYSCSTSFPFTDTAYEALYGEHVVRNLTATGTVTRTDSAMTEAGKLAGTITRSGETYPVTGYYSIKFHKVL